MRVLGNISVQTKNGRVVKIILGSDKSEGPNEVLREIEEYLSGQRKNFSFQVEIRGTPFQKRVWEEVRKIPYGETKTYSEIAKKLGTSPRAVGQALSKNPLPLYIPCHRVVSKKGLGGFSAGLEWKRYLIDLERARK
ncbi:methylated-DNA/protein-cysteine methyltransferase [Thermotoga petrophila RKU-10]|uniref:Methylated-DNA--protein-cysteine methyltransferase n=1 Tax=Thermotoga petrophila (strain ATCC BAA-489 / DSM 13996 / JCM 10882 / RKU-10) TaxID=590168 RepID=D2C5B2_THEP2|nr:MULTISPECIES: methylated-DNA--[protein]-cysteine S-methyltransferase [Thermotoga]ADA66148.1 methylated-DNA/protein-cysteine methyltransferase [Thermotoga petrophila RKU-10]KAF2959642.1 cysteine methyltransferase [Thermotoga sp. 38H-to]